VSLGAKPPLTAVPVIDVSALWAGTSARAAVAAEIGQACRAQGFFYVTGHGVDLGVCDRLVAASRHFFALDPPTKMHSRMSLGGRAWRGYFPAGGELTSGRPDWKEGLYLGSELPDDHPLVRARTPLHGRNVFPSLPAFRGTVLAYIDALTRLGHALMEGIALSLGLDATYFADRYTADPLILFRIFNYPSRPAPMGQDVRWGVGEHSDYGLLTILWQDDVGGLQVKTREGWIEAPPVAESFVCNIGDMLDRMTGGLYRSTPHRVALNTSGRDRLRCPSSSTRTSRRGCVRSRAWLPPRRRRAGWPAGTERTSMPSTGPTAITCWARSRRSSPSCAARCSSVHAP
jgi:polar amino acid transport system ATP-binding protein